MNRRRLLHALLATALLATALVASRSGLRAGESAHRIDVDAILNDPDAPVFGNPNGDVTVVAFIDYNCPFCRKSDPDLRRVVAADGKIRLVTKDWPILALSSVAGARLALAAKYQGRYDDAHDALLALRGKRATEESMRGAIKAAGVDMARLDADLAAHGDAIDALIRRNAEQADSLGLKGTPVYLIGPYRVEAALDADGFTEVIAKFRQRIAK